MNTEQRTTHWRRETDDDGILWLHLDHADASVNVLSRAVIEELEALLDQLHRAPPKAVVIRSAKPKGFIAGADVHEFTTLESSGQALALIRRGHRAFDRLEALGCPTLALIHGHCLGGGLELALACRYRIADDGPATRLGLPEVRLGIHPGFGGTARLIRLLGAAPAMDLMLTGRSVDARKARKLGLVDAAVATRHLLRAARRLLLEQPPIRRPTRAQRVLGLDPIRPLVAPILRRQVRKVAAPEHYPAPYALIDLWQQHGGNPRLMQEEEGRSVASLITGATAQNLVRVFFLQERLKGLATVTDTSIERVHVIGAGRMGGDIAAWCARQGLLVTLQDRSPQQIAPAIKRAHELFAKQWRDPRQVQQAMDRLLPDPRGDGVPKADLVIEAVFEDVPIKHALLRTIEPRLKRSALLATNTSSIPLETLAEVLERPERLIGLHFFNPVAKMPLVEVVQTSNTSAEAITRALAFVRRIDRLPLPVKSAPGFLVNRILMPYVLEAVLLEAEGVPVTAIDQAATAFGMPMGPLLLADTVGLDICLSVGRMLAPHTGITVPPRLAERVQAGQLGRKGGQGFYRHVDGRALAPTTLRPSFGRGKTTADAEAIKDRLLFSMLRECIHCLRDGIVADADLLDAGMLFGTGFPPFRGGPMRYLHQEGPAALQQRFDALRGQHGERFAALDWNAALAQAAMRAG